MRYIENNIDEILSPCGSPQLLIRKPESLLLTKVKAFAFINRHHVVLLQSIQGICCLAGNISLFSIPQIMASFRILKFCKINIIRKRFENVFTLRSYCLNS